MISLAIIFAWYALGLSLMVYTTAIIDPDFTLTDVVVCVLAASLGPLLLLHALYWTWRVRHPSDPLKPRRTLFSIRIPVGKTESRDG